MKLASQDHDDLVAEINVTPLVDVMLVLLIIFMVVAPFIEQGVNITLPKANAPEMKNPQEPLVIGLTQKGSILLNGKGVSKKQLESKLSAILKQDENRLMYLKADGRIAYERVVQVMALLKRLGAKNLGMLTQPDDR